MLALITCIMDTPTSSLHKSQGWLGNVTNGAEQQSRTGGKKICGRDDKQFVLFIVNSFLAQSLVLHTF